MSRASGWVKGGFISFARGAALVTAAALVMSAGACGDDEEDGRVTSSSSTSSSSSSGTGAHGGAGAQGGAGAEGGGPVGGGGGDGGTGGVEETCTDGIQNGDETDVDCGGARCEPCDDGQTCVEPDDCNSGFCDTSGGTGGAGGSGGAGGAGGNGGNGGAGGGPTSGVCAPCDGATDCQAGQYCDEGTCVPALPNGDACTETAECTSGQCIDGVCCNTACGGGAAGDCQACNLAGLEGTCSPEPAATACGSPTADACTAADTCDGAGACVPNDAAAGTACGDQGVACHNNDTCNGSGACTDNGLVAAGSACGDATDTACTNPDTCDANGSCVPNNAAAGAPCGDQGIACLVNDTCDGSGACTDNGFSPTGTACGDATVNECTAADTCNGAGTCNPNHVAAGTACGSTVNNDCTNPDTCSGGGVCNPNHEPLGTACGNAADTACTNPDTCDAVGTCLENNAAAGTACDNGFFCDGVDTCDAGGECDSQGDPCALPNVCGEVSNSCVGAPFINELHYDDTGTDDNEFVEIFLPAGIDPGQVQLILYNGNGGVTYATHLGSSFTAGTASAAGTLYWKLIPGIQNGGDAATPAPDGMALVVNGVVVQFLSYEGSFAATAGPANGMTSTNIGVVEGDATLSSSSLALVGGVWIVAITATPGAVNL